MTTLFPRGYGGIPSYQFSSPDQFNTRYHNGRYPRQRVSFAPRYTRQPLYQPPFYNTEGYAAPAINQFRQPGVTTQLVNLFNELDAQYRYEQYLRQLEKMQRQYWKQQPNNLPLTMYSTPLPPPPPSLPPLPPPMNYDPNTIYHYEKVTRYIPFPVYIGPGGGGYGSGGGYSPGGFLGTGGSNFMYGTGGGMGVSPKIRVIFIPAGQSFSQQPYTGSLGMPPFLYNRMSQPLCSFPLPPPLPQIGSLPLSPAVQQMVMQRYSNPIAVLPFTSNWQIPQLMMPSYPLVPQQQQQSILPASVFPSFPPAPQAYIPPPVPLSAPPSAFQSFPSAPQAYLPPPPPVPLYAPASAFQSFPSAPQAYIPPSVPLSAPASAFQSFPSAPQAYIPPPPPVPLCAPPSAFQSFPSAPQAYIPPPPPVPLYASASAFQSSLLAPQSYIPAPVPSYAPISALSSFPSAPQAYNPVPPPAPIMPANLPVLSPPSLQLPYPNANAAPSLPQYSYSGYPSMCRACPPAPPPLNISVTGHCWVQHCCACHQVPTAISNPNVRPVGGRITPLLRHPTVPQYVPEQINQHQQQYFHDNAHVMMRPWLRKTPPLPPGGVLISDEYVDRNGSYWRYGPSERQQRPYKRSSHAKRRSATVSSKTASATSQKDTKHNKSVSPARANKNDNNRTQQQGPIKSQSATSISSSNTSTSGLSAEYDKTTLPPPKLKQDIAPQQLNRESRNIQFQYNYQPQELSTVYLRNRYLKSSSEASTLSSIAESQSDGSSPSVNGRSPTLSPSSDSSSIKKESNFKKIDENPLRPSSQPKKPKERLIIIRQFRSNSPSTISTLSTDRAPSTISSNMAFSIIDDDKDSILTTSTIKANKLEENDVLRRHIF